MLSKFFTSMALEFFEALDTPLSLACAMCVKANEYQELCQFDTKPETYLNAEDYFRDACAVSLFKKLVPNRENDPLFKERRLQKKQKALKGWLEAEQQCRVTNGRILSSDATLSVLLESVRRELITLIGLLPSKIDFRLGKGSTYQHRGERNLLQDRLAFYPEGTPNTWIHRREWAKTAWARQCFGGLFFRPTSGVEYWSTVMQFSHDTRYKGNAAKLRLLSVRGNRWASVPKNMLKDRSIGVEPTFNLSIQLGIGEILKTRLSSKGLLLRGESQIWKYSESQQLHRQLAQKASQDESLATIDLSSASDTIAVELVRRLLPSDWFSLLDSVRSPETSFFFRGHDEKEKSEHWFELSKFSSMGNGYTFELETAIFAAVAIHVLKKCGVEPIIGHNVSVFGDDIIVPTECAEEVIAALRQCGFLPNYAKTFLSGPFRESCGGDYWNGIDVRPIFPKNDPKGINEMYTLYNQVYALSLKKFSPDLRRVLNVIRKRLPVKYRRYGPSELGDICLHAPEAFWTYRTRNSIRWFKVCLPRPVSIPLCKWDKLTGVVSCLYGAGRDPSVSVEGRVRTARVPWS